VILLIAATSSGQVILNEVLAANQTAFSNGDTYPDYVELHNSSASTQNLGGFSLTDNFTQPRKFVFPANTLISPGGYLLVWCDSQTNAPGLHANFALNNNGEAVGFYAANGALLDSVTFGIQIPDLALGRIPDAAGGWTLTVPTPAQPNVPQPLGDGHALVFNEWMANASPAEDWLEIYNTTNLPVAIGDLVFTDQIETPPTNRALPALSFIAANGFIQFIADDLRTSAADHLDFKLSSTSGETLTLYAKNRIDVLDRVTFGPQTLNISQGRLPDGGTNIIFFRPNFPTPAESNFLAITNVVVNELLTHTDPPLEDAVELFNPTAQPVDISYWWLSNNRDDPMRYRIPAGTVIPPGQFKVIYEYQFNSNGLGFTFNSYEAGEVVLCTADAAGKLTGERLEQPFNPAQNGVSFGRYQTSQGVDFVAMSKRSFGMDTPTTLAQFRTGTGNTNPYPAIGPVVINELMYHPPDISVNGILADNTDDEFIELFNATNGPTPLFDPAYPTNRWRLRGAVSFDFPQNLTIPAWSYFLVVGFDLANTELLEAFRTKYRLPPDTLILGPYSGKLDNRGETINLQKPDAPQPFDRPKPGLVPYLQVDRITYADRLPWSDVPDGRGASLQRRGALVYGNDPIHWLAASPTPGQPNLIESPRISDAARLSSGSFIFQFNALAGVAYAVEWQTNLFETSPSILTNVAAATFSRKIQVSDPEALDNGSERFYRIRVAPHP